MMHVGLAAAAILIGSAAMGDIVREGAGERRATLDRMELKAMPASWGDLTSWRGDEVTSATTAGKPVLIVSWASWYPQSVRALSTAQRMADTYGPRGLVVVGVHHKDGFAGADKAASSRNATFPIAHDESGAFRNALHVDNDPDFYLIDRAGQLRYADVASSSVEEAVKELVSESEDVAGNIEALRAERAAAIRAEQERLVSINQDINDLAEIEVPFAEPTPDAYKDLNWPRVSEQALENIGVSRSRSSRNSNEPPPDVQVTVPQTTPYPSMPNLKGRVVAIYMWHPSVRASYWPDMHDMDILQRKYGRDVRVIGVMVPYGQLFDTNRNDEEETVEEMNEAFEKFTRSREFDHTLVLDAEGQLQQSFGGSARTGRGGTFGTSRLVLLSSDGVLRWTGHTSAYEGPLDLMLRIDPGVKARRAAERAYIEGRR